MLDYYKAILAHASSATAPWFGSRPAWMGCSLTTLFGLGIFAKMRGWAAAMDEGAVWIAFGVGGFFSVWGAIFFVNLIRAPWMIDQDLRSQLAAKESRTTAEKWRALRMEFAELGEHAYDNLSLDWNKEGKVDHGWHFRGAPQLIPHFEPLARRGAKLVRRSRYCQQKLRAEVMGYQDETQLWAEAIRALTGSFRINDRIMWSEDEHGKRIHHLGGSIDRVIQASGLLCLEMESREDDA